MSTAAQRRSAAFEDEARSQIADLLRRVQALEAVKPRDAADAALRQALALSTEGLAFVAADIFRRAQQLDPDLRRALADATIASTAELGAWLRDHAGVRDGIAIVRLRRHRHWRVAYTSTTLSADVGSV